ncbi:MAG: hypothetical protein WA777_03510 [Rhodanobacter sp.]
MNAVLMSPAIATCYHIYGVCDGHNLCLFVDYLADDLTDHKRELLKRLRHSTDDALRRWHNSANLRDIDIFEIDCVDDQDAAQEAVVFWRGHFRALGETIIADGHLCDRLV